MVISCLLLVNLVLSSLDELFDILVFDFKLHLLVLFRDISLHLLHLHHLLEYEVLIFRCPILIAALLPPLMRCARVSVAALRSKGLHIRMIERIVITAWRSLWKGLGGYH
jgi:hypothetical protein